MQHVWVSIWKVQQERSETTMNEFLRNFLFWMKILNVIQSFVAKHRSKQFSISLHNIIIKTRKILWKTKTQQLSKYFDPKTFTNFYPDESRQQKCCHNIESRARRENFRNHFATEMRQKTAVRQIRNPITNIQQLACCFVNKIFSKEFLAKFSWKSRKSPAAVKLSSSLILRDVYKQSWRKYRRRIIFVWDIN